MIIVRLGAAERRYIPSGAPFEGSGFSHGNPEVLRGPTRIALATCATPLGNALRKYEPLSPRQPLPLWSQ